MPAFFVLIKNLVELSIKLVLNDSFFAGCGGGLLTAAAWDVNFVTNFLHFHIYLIDSLGTFRQFTDDTFGLGNIFFVF